MALSKLPPSFYLRPTVQVARDLLGKYIVHKFKGKRLVGRIVEVEAYCRNDPASHSYRGQTERNRVMFWTGGHLYVYFTYGMHFCANVVTRNEGVGEAVLLRAVEPVDGLKEMMKQRGTTPQEGGGQAGDYGSYRRIANLTNGPAKVCKAFGIDRRLNGADLTGNRVFIGEIKNRYEKIKIGASTRVGIVSGQEKMWRFYIKENPFVSKAKVHP